MPRDRAFTQEKNAFAGNLSGALERCGVDGQAAAEIPWPATPRRWARLRLALDVEIDVDLLRCCAWTDLLRRTAAG